MKQYDALVEAYSKRCEVRNIGAETIYSRRREIERFGLWVKRKRPRPRLENINAEIILDYLNIVSTFKAKSTVYAKFSNLRCFFDFLVQENIWKKNPLKWIRGPKMILNSHVPKSLGQSEVERLFEACFKSRDPIFQYSLPTIFLALYSLGLRRGEVLRLNFDCWDRKEKSLKVLNSKSGHERLMPVPESLERALEAYVPIRQNSLAEKQIYDEPALFINRFGERLSAHAITTHFKRCARKAGIKQFSLHQLRHTCATNLLSKGVPIMEVKLVLGHACIDTTLRYTHVAGPERWAAIQKHPLNEFLSSAKGGGVCH
jgi:site-specific recombinase XerD